MKNLTNVAIWSHVLLLSSFALVRRRSFFGSGPAAHIIPQIEIFGKNTRREIFQLIQAMMILPLLSRNQVVKYACD